MITSNNPELLIQTIERLKPGAIEQGEAVILEDNGIARLMKCSFEISENSLLETEALINTKQAAWNAATQAFKALPLGKQALWEPVRDKVAGYIQQGDFQSAYQVIATVPSLYEGMEDDRATFLALFSGQF